MMMDDMAMPAPMGMSMGMGMGMDDMHMMGHHYGDACSSLTLMEPLPFLEGDDWVTISDIKMLLDTAFPNTTVGGPWAALYWTKKYNGMDIALGGYPTPLDTKFPFEAAGPPLGQPGAMGPHHCPEDAPTSTNAGPCPKLVLSEDYTEYGIADHIPPHIALRAVYVAISEGCGILDDLFDYDKYECNFDPEVLLQLIRAEYPRNPVDGSVSYPPPKIPGEPEYFPFEFPSPQGSPHWCDQAAIDNDVYADWCPYMPDGFYRHPHLALAAVEVYLSNHHMPEMCAPTWLEQNPDYPPDVDHDTSQAFPLMADESLTDAGKQSQPADPYVWPGPAGRKKKAAAGAYVLDLVIQPTP